MSDPVADKSGFLRMYMSNHPDTLVAYAKWYGKVPETIVSAEMAAIDSQCMTLTCTLKEGTKGEVRVAFDPPLSGYDAVKPRLLEMKAIAQEGLGMIKVPQIKSFHLPLDAAKSALFILVLCCVTFSPHDSPSPLFVPARLIHSFIDNYTIKIMWAVLVLAHVLESFYTFSLCRKHSTGFFVGAGYVIATVIFGFPIWMDMQKRVQAARIESVMKVE